MSKYNATNSDSVILAIFFLKHLKELSLCFLSMQNLTISWVKFAGQVLFEGSCRANKALDITSMVCSNSNFNGVLQFQRSELLGVTIEINSNVF